MASRSLREMPVDELAALVAARTSVPAGGAVAALTTELAAGLAAMAGRFSDTGTAESGHHTESVAQADALRQAAEPLADEDAAGYAAFLAALAEPDDGDPGLRRERVERARSRTVDVPLAMAEIAAQCAVLAADLAMSGNRSVRGDAATAVALCHATTTAASIMVAENLGNASHDERAHRVRSAARKAAAALDRVLALFPGAAG